MNGLISWARLEAGIAPTCPKGSSKGRQPYPLPVMLRVHCVQPFCNLRDPAMENLPCEAESVRHLARVSPEKVPDETTTPTSAAGWSAANWRSCRSGNRGSPGRAGGAAEGGQHR